MNAEIDELKREMVIVRSDVHEVKSGLREILAFQKSFVNGFKFMIGLFVIATGSLSGVVYLTKNNRESLALARVELARMHTVTTNASRPISAGMYCPTLNDQ